MIQDINAIIMTPLTIVVLLIISVALLFVTIYLCISIRDLKEFIRNTMTACLDSQNKVLDHCKKVIELDVSLNKDCKNLIKAIEGYLHLK